MNERVEGKIDDAVDKATDILENYLERACGWFLCKVDKMKEKSNDQDNQPAEKKGTDGKEHSVNAPVAETGQGCERQPQP